MNHKLHQTNNRKPVQVHMTNIAGLGAVQLLQSLLPKLEGSPDYVLEKVYLPSIGELASYKIANPVTHVLHYKRILPNSISRLLECALSNALFIGDTPLLVMGDLPLAGRDNQTLFVQSPLLTRGASTGQRIGAMKYWIARLLFRRNIKHVFAFVVQTQAMKDALIDTYPEIKGRVHVIAQPAPTWLLDSGLKRAGRVCEEAQSMKLFYPAAVYPHKNHRLLGEISELDVDSWPISELVLTVPNESHPNRAISWIKSVGRLVPESVINAYAKADALLFLSLSESFGFPLVEAMWIGLPIICPDRPYAHALCGDQAIYFDPEDLVSLKNAVINLQERLRQGWWPDWTKCLKSIPRDWNEVAETMLAIASGDIRVSECAAEQ